jgi:hypothetical protein
MKVHLGKGKSEIIITGLMFLCLFTLFPTEAVTNNSVNGAPGSMKIGWGSSDITPDRSVVITGGSAVRISQGVSDPITATALVIDSPEDLAIMVSTDLIGISDLLNERIKENVAKRLPDMDFKKIFFNSTHTHTAPDQATSPALDEMHKKYGIDVPEAWARWGYDMGVMTAEEYADFAAERIAEAIEQAWKNKAPGGVSYGLAHASIGQNRLTAYYDGSSQMYGSTSDPNFSNMEGYEDHSVNLIYTWDSNGELTGLVVNVSIPSQVQYGSTISSDYWYETRIELRQRLGKGLFVLPQCSAAGDQSPRIMIDHRAEKRMEKITGRTQREQIAVRIADAVESILPFMEKNIEWNPVFKHKTEVVELNRRALTKEDIIKPMSTFHNPVKESVEQAFDRLLGEYKKLVKELDENPKMKEKPNWFVPVSSVHWLLGRAYSTIQRYEFQKTNKMLLIEVHVVRIGDMAIATNPFELYLDYGMQMKARSKSIHTFVVELSGPTRGYLPTYRAVAGGAYGAIPQSTLIGPDGGRDLVDQTLGLIDSLWE